MAKEYSPRDLFDRRAEEYQQKFMDVSAYSDGLDFFYDALSSNVSKLLDIACGPGNLSRYLLNKNSKLSILGTDIAPNMIRLARNNNPEASFEELDCRKILKLNRKFDGIICGFCLPYLTESEVEKFIKDCCELLNKDGVLYLSTMQHTQMQAGLQTSSNGDQLFTFYHRAEFLFLQLEKIGFKIIYGNLQKPNYNDGSTTSDIIIVAIKKSAEV